MRLKRIKELDLGSERFPKCPELNQKPYTAESCQEIVVTGLALFLR